MGPPGRYAGRDGLIVLTVAEPGKRPESFSIRPFREEDREAVNRIWRAAFAESTDDPNQIIDFCLRTKHGALFVGCLGKQVVATAMAGHDGRRAWLHRIATAPDHRGHGYARRLVAHAEAHLADLGAPRINLHLPPRNEAVRGFYEKLGYAAEPRTQMIKRFSKTPPLAVVSDDGIPVGQLEVAITHLEMTRPPRLPAPPPPALKLAVLRADDVSVPFYRYLYNTVGGPWLWYERRQISDHDLAAIIRHPEVEIYVLYVGGEPAGYAELDRRAMPDIELVFFGLMPHFIGRKLGPWLLHWVIDAAWARAPQRLWLHTCSLDHPRAIAHYQRAGFVPFKQERKLIVDPRPLP
jgi:GNAT superfamily N-acetyltransferase